MTAPIEPVVSPRRERRRRTRTLLAAARVGVLAAGAAALWVIFTLALSSSTFALRRVEVSGLKQLPRQAALSLAAIPGDRSIFRVPTRAIRRRLESHPAIQRARVVRRLPGTMRIEITERPVAALVRQDGKTLFVDWKGAAFACDACSTSGLTEVVGAPSGGHLPQSIAGPLAALRAFQEAGLWCREVSVSPSGGLRATLPGGVLLKIGLPEKLPEKAAKARLALAGLPRERVEYIDVSCPTAIVWKPRDGADRAGW